MTDAGTPIADRRRARLAQLAVLGLGAAACVVLAIGITRTPIGAMIAGAEIRRTPAALALVALIVLLRGRSALPAAAGWMALGLAGAVALRAAFGVLGADGWIPGEATSKPQAAAEAAWLTLAAVMAWRAGPAAWSGPLLAAAVATTRIGGYGQALVPLMWEDTLAEALVLGAGVLTGLVAGVLALLVAGWALAIIARLPARWLAPGHVLGVLAAAAAIRHMLQV